MNPFVALILFVALPLHAATYYVDFLSGNNASAGTATNTAWKNIPGSTLASDHTIFITGAGWPAGKVQPGDTIKLKSGSLCDSNINGMVRFNSTYYSTAATVANPILVQRDTTWGSGAVTFDGATTSTGITGFGLMHITIGGVTFDGVTTDGMVIKNAPRNGISSFDSGAQLEGISVYYTYFFNNGTIQTDTGASASEGDISLRWTTNGVIANSRLDGNGSFQNGIAGGDSGRWVQNLLVRDCIVSNHVCTVPLSGDWGIGIKVYQGSMVVSNCILAHNFKGADQGLHQSGFDGLYKYIGNTVYSNDEAGVNFNGGFVLGATNTNTCYFINNIVRDNGTWGTYVYGGRMQLYLVGNVYHNNGTDDTFDSCNLQLGNNDSPTSEGSFRVFLRNNIFYKPGPNPTTGFNYKMTHWRINESGINKPSNFSMDSDYNSWVQTGSQGAIQWGSHATSSGGADFAYGANGPGHASGDWYNFYGGSTTQPTNDSIGHFHCDANSKGTGAADASLPPFTSESNRDYTQTNSYAGQNLSALPWYLAEMAVDKNGVARSEWTMGAYEFVPPASAHGGVRFGPGLRLGPGVKIGQ